MARNLSVCVCVCVCGGGGGVGARQSDKYVWVGDSESVHTFNTYSEFILK